jgi:UDP:flavonoid glycosyltransferase YjiC (YdhE family)
MRVLCLCVPGVGHVAMMVPVARELRRAGHEVRLATGPDFLAQAERSGFTGVAAGPTRAFAKRERLRRHPESVDVPPEEQQRFHVTRVWAGIYAPLTLPDLLAEIERWRPDLLVYDSASYSGPLACALAGIPGASHSFGPAFPAELAELAGAAVEPLWKENGLAAPPAGGMLDDLHIDVWPASLQLPDSARSSRTVAVRTTGPLARREETAGATGLPLDVAALPGPVVHLTLGTIFNHDPELFAQVIAGLDNECGSLVVTTGPDQDPSVLGPQPPWVRAERFLPHHALLPHCDLVVSHSGAGTTLAALGHGIPSLLLPRAADGFRAAEGCVRTGTGRRLKPPEVSPEAVRREARALLGGAGYREGAQRLRDEIAAMPDPAEVVRELERLAG